MADKRNIPAVELVLQHLKNSSLPRPVLTQIVRRELENYRKLEKVPELSDILENLSGKAKEAQRRRFQPVINATGILLHTNLGRSPLSRSASQIVQEVAEGYCNLEFDLVSGQRGKRAGYVEELLAMLCEAEAATVVNNCAAALVLVLRHFTKEKPEVIISRGELVQIGGGFRIPEILEASGAKLKEVGTTNKTAVQDYARAITSATGLILKVHQSNFVMMGFVESASTSELAKIAREAKVPLVEDLGSGAICQTNVVKGLAQERTPQQCLGSGADLVCFSGDKLFGGPQAGIIAGKKSRVEEVSRNPLFRALRCDKLILSALQATAEAYLSNGACSSSNVLLWQMMQISVEELEQRARSIIEKVKNSKLQIQFATVISSMGGGTLPESEIPSAGLQISATQESLESIATKLRLRQPAIIGRIHEDKLLLDLRTVFPTQDAILIQALESI